MDVRSLSLLGKLLFAGRYLEHVSSWSTWHTILVLLFSDFCFPCTSVFLLPSISLVKHFTILVKEVLIIAVSHTTIADVHLYFHPHTVVDSCHSYYSNPFLVIYRMKRKIRKIEQGVNFIKKLFCCFCVTFSEAISAGSDFLRATHTLSLIVAEACQTKKKLFFFSLASFFHLFFFCFLVLFCFLFCYSYLFWKYFIYVSFFN